MPVVQTQQIVQRAFTERYGVAAINVVNDLTMEAVLAAAEALRAPLIVQTSVKTVKSIGADVLFAMWTEMTRDLTVPVALHLDHCPERDIISLCLDKGWNSVLFDGSNLSVEENKRQTIEVVEEAARYGALVEGEIEGFKRVEEMAEDEGVDAQALETAVDFVRSTGVDIFAPAIGNAHGMYTTTPKLDSQRVTDIVEATGKPVALHGGTGMTPEQFTDLIARGCAKVNISTALKIAFIQAGYDYVSEHATEYDPPKLFAAQRAAVLDMAKEHIAKFGAQGARVVSTLIFDCDGVLADTERDGHRVAFNATFREFGIPVEWSEEEYAVKLQIAGGKERMASLLTPEFVRANGLPADADGQAETLASWHKRKTAIYTDMVAGGTLPTRPGIRRIITEAQDAGWTLAVASTSAEPSVRAILERAAGATRAGRFDLVLAGDVVEHKKPASDIYLLALERLGVPAAGTLVIEDSRNGLLAANGAGLRCVMTVNGYTEEEDNTEAVLVVSSLGDPGGERTRIIANRSSARPGDFITLTDLERCLAPESAVPS